jgi:hypothetical protein
MIQINALRLSRCYWLGDALYWDGECNVVERVFRRGFW